MATMDQLKTHIEKAKTEFSDAIKKAEDKKKRPHFSTEEKKSKATRT